MGPDFVIPVLVVLAGGGLVMYLDLRNTPRHERTWTVTPPTTVRTLTAPTDPHQRALEPAPWYLTGGN